MAPARRRAPARNGTSAKSIDETTTASPEKIEISLPRRAAATLKKQQPSRRTRGKKATPEADSDSESDNQHMDEHDEEAAVIPEAEGAQDEDEQITARRPAATQAGGPLVQLRYNEPLSWRPGKPIPTEELIRRLSVLSRELSDLDQETFDTESLAKVAKELASHNLLNHKDKGVKAFTAACLVDILCLCAPNAPFTQTQLKVRQVPSHGIRKIGQAAN